MTNDLKPYRPRPYQEKLISDTADALRDTPTVLAVMPTGAGKCHPAGTRVLLYNGDIKAVEHIRAGDQLLGSDSKPRNVLSTNSGYGPIVEIRPHQGQPWYCNDAHILTLVRTPTHEAGDYTVNISVKEYLLKPTRWQHLHQLFHAGRINFHQTVQAKTARTIPPYILGILLGHGRLTNHRTAATNCEPSTVRELEQYTQKLELLPTLLQSDNTAPTYAINRSIEQKRTPITDECRKLGITEQPAGHQFIPKPYLISTVEERLELLAGLIDTDGRLDQTSYIYTTKSRQLAQNTAYLARSLGMAAILNPELVDEAECWNISITGPIDTIPCRLHHQQTQYRQQGQSHLHTGFSIIPTGPDTYYGFTLDQDGRYLLDDFTVTHNTITFAEIARRAVERGNTVAIIVHRQELIKQSEEAVLRQSGIQPGIVWGASRQWDQPITIISHGTIQRADPPA